MLRNICRSKNKNNKKNKELPQAHALTPDLPGRKNVQTKFGCTKSSSFGTSHFQKGIPSTGILKGWEGKGRGGLGQPSSLLQLPRSIQPSFLLFIHPSIRSVGERPANSLQSLGLDPVVTLRAARLAPSKSRRGIMHSQSPIIP